MKMKGNRGRIYYARPIRLCNLYVLDLEKKKLNNTDDIEYFSTTSY